MKALQGTWDVIALEVEGQGLSQGAFGGSQIILEGEQFRTISMGAEYAGTFTIDTTNTPHTLDITFTSGPHAGLKSLGIFTLEGDTWTLCLGLAGRSRPQKFATTPGSGHALETLTRATTRRPASGRTTAKADKPIAVGNTGAWSEAIAEHGGEWSMVSLDQSGKPMVPEAYLPHGLRVVRGNELTGDTARYCMGAPGDPRPTEFETKPGDGRTLSVWKRV